MCTCVRVCVCVCQSLFQRGVHIPTVSRGCQGCTLDWRQRRRQCDICDVDPGRWIDVPVFFLKQSEHTSNLFHSNPSGCLGPSFQVQLLKQYLFLTHRHPSNKCVSAVCFRKSHVGTVPGVILTSRGMVRI